MIYRVCGRAGSGKTEYMLGLLGDALSVGGEAVVIVPEQQSLDYEHKVFTRFGGSANMLCEILNFERLPNRTYRDYGGLNLSCIDAAGRSLLMAQAIQNKSSELLTYKSIEYDKDFVKTVTGMAQLMKQNGVTPNMLDDVKSSLPPSLSRKTHDIAVIVGEYDRLLGEFGADSGDALTVYADKLDEMPFFVGKTVIIDSFYSFTWQEHRIIDAIARQAENVYISFLYDNDDTTGLFDETRASYLRVSRFSRVRDIILPDNRRAQSKSLAFAEEAIWKASPDVFEGDDGGLEFVACKSPFEECEAAAATITSLISGGMRMKDIAVIPRNSADYDGVIDAVLKKHGLNAFLSAKDELAVKPLAVFITAAVGACVDGFSPSSVKKYIKSGCTGLSPRSVRLLLRYIDTWSIRGKVWLSTEPWTANPDGYIEIPTERQKRELAEVNEAKTIISEQLSALYDSFSGEGKPAVGYCKALYTHMLSCGADKQILKRASSCRASGDEDGAQKLSQLWEQVIGVLDMIASACGEKLLSPERFLFMLELALSEHKVTTIPLYADAVTIGDASMIRPNNVKAVILLGVNDGTFPASAINSGLLRDDELVRLEDKGIILGDTAKAQRAKEKLYFYTALAAASENVTVIYNDARPSRPSVTAMRLMKLFPSMKRRTFGDTFYDKAFSPEAAAGNASEMPEKVRQMLAERGRDLLSDCRAFPLCDGNAVISKSASVTFTPSRLEKYSYCAFSYFGRYVLGLTVNKKAEFDYPEIGSFVHKILELFISSRVTNGRFENPTDDEIRDAVNELTERYILSVCRGGDRRFKYICTRLKNTLFHLLRNISDELNGGSFVPVAFEKRIGGEETAMKSPDGIPINVYGTVDRIDEFKKGRSTYIRVVDYKTGNTVFSKKALREGLGLQMFIYMFSVCEKEGKKPAGVLYVPASLSPSREDTPADAADTEAFLKKRFRRSGLLLADNAVVDAMEDGIKGVYLPARLKKDETFDYRSSVATVEQLGRLKLSIEKYIGALADRLAGGNMCASPLKVDADHNACRFCDMKAVCRLASDDSVVRRHSDISIEVGDDNA